MDAASAIYVSNFIPLDIEARGPKAKGQAQMNLNKFVYPSNSPAGGPNV
jgi:hypothetical protein